MRCPLGARQTDFRIIRCTDEQTLTFSLHLNNMHILCTTPVRGRPQEFSEASLSLACCGYLLLCVQYYTDFTSSILITELAWMLWPLLIFIRCSLWPLILAIIT